jgi:hypothetical protein
VRDDADAETHVADCLWRRLVAVIELVLFVDLPSKELVEV